MQEIVMIVSVIINLIIVGLFIWYRKAIEAFILFRTQKALEDYKLEVKNREKAAQIARLFALRLARIDDCYEINKILLELPLILPRELVVQLGETMENLHSDQRVMELFVSIRKHLGLDDGLKPEEITYYVPPRSAGESM